eukprot:14351_2
MRTRTRTMKKMTMKKKSRNCLGQTKNMIFLVLTVTTLKSLKKEATLRVANMKMCQMVMVMVMAAMMMMMMMMMMMRTMKMKMKKHQQRYPHYPRKGNHSPANCSQKSIIISLQQQTQAHLRQESQ